MLWRTTYTSGESTNFPVGLLRGLIFISDRVGFEEHSVSCEDVLLPFWGMSWILWTGRP